MNLENDAEWMAIRREFLASLEVRQSRLQQALKVQEGQFVGASDRIRWIDQCYRIVHSLAGAAGSYGLNSLGTIAEGLDDLMSHPEYVQNQRLSLISFLYFLDEALGQVRSTQEDVPGLSSDPRWNELISAVRSLPE